MKNIWLALPLALVMGIQASPAAAQGAGSSDFENEFAQREAQIGSASGAATPATDVTMPTTQPVAPAVTAPAPTAPAAPDATAAAPSIAAPTMPSAPEITATAPAAPEAPAAPMDNAAVISPSAAAAEESPVVAPADAGGILANDPLEAFRQAQNNAPGAPGAPINPLGPAATLPVGANLPAGAYALNGPKTQEEIQAQMEAEAKMQEERLKQQAFDSALNGLLPLSPPQTRKVLETFRDSREAAETPIAMPTPRTTVQTVSLDPSAPPPVIRTSPGYVTTVTILDMTGAPWAIQDVSWAGKFEVTTPEEGGHVIRFTPMSAHGVGNISVRLVDLITPVTFSIQTGLDEVDYRFDARIPKQGPLAKTPLIEYGGIKAVAGNDENLMRVLDGTGVTEGEKLKMDGVDGSTTAWRIDGAIYLRTPLTLLSPAWDSSATSADGMNVYTLTDVPVILLSDRGRMVKARVVNESDKM